MGIIAGTLHPATGPEGFACHTTLDFPDYAGVWLRRNGYRLDRYVGNVAYYVVTDKSDYEVTDDDFVLVHNMGYREPYLLHTNNVVLATTARLIFSEPTPQFATASYFS